MTKHHILPKRFFKSKPARQFTFELCRECHDELEMNINLLEAGTNHQKLHEMRYIKVLIIFITKKAKNYDVVHLDSIVVGVLSNARTYFNRTSNGKIECHTL